MTKFGNFRTQICSATSSATAYIDWPLYLKRACINVRKSSPNSPKHWWRREDCSKAEQKITTYFPCPVPWFYIYFFFDPMIHMSFTDFLVFPPGHGRSVTDFWGWDAHEARLRYPHDVSDDIGGPLNLISTNLPRPWSPRESSPSGNIPTVEPGIEPGTSWLVVRDSDH